MSAPRSLYQLLAVKPNAGAGEIEAAYRARMAAAADRPDEQVVLRQAFEVLADPASRQRYDERQKEALRRAAASGGEQERVRPANRAARPAEAEGEAPSWWSLRVVVALAVLAVASGAIWLHHQREREAQRLQQERHAAELARRAEQDRLREERAKQAQENVDWAKQRIDRDRALAEQRRRQELALRQQEAQRRDAERAAARAMTEQRRRETEERRAELEQRRLDQQREREQREQLLREQQYLREQERNRPAVTTVR